MNTRLFINDKEVEINEAVDFALNKAFEDIYNPTVIINDWTKTINIPFSENNNQLFGSIFSVDRQILGGVPLDTGIYFDPTKKADFKLFHNQSLVMTGYCKMTTVSINNAGSYYNINLFGQLGNIFLELKQLSFSATDKYKIAKDDNSEYFEEFINKDIIRKSWTEKPKNYLLENADWNDIIGFSCSNQGYYTGFDSSTIQTGPDIDQAAEEIIAATGHTYKTSPSAIVGNGLLPRQMGEFRSYYQIPYIYVNKMFQMLQKKCYDLTDYRMILDKHWFNSINPYYNDLVMMMNSSFKEDTVTNNTYAFNPLILKRDWTYPIIDRQYNYPTDVIPVSEIKPIVQNNTFLIDPEYKVNIQMPYKFRLQWDNTADGDVHLTDDGCFVIAVRLIGNNGTQKIVHKTVLKSPQYNYADDGISNIINFGQKFNKEELHPNINYYKDIEDTFSYSASYAEFGAGVFVDFLTYWDSPNSPMVIMPYGSLDVPYLFGFFNDPYSLGIDTASIRPINQGYTDISIIESRRSNSKVTIKDFWDENTSFFDCILNYCKTYGIIFLVDDINKTLTLMHRTTYFKDYSIMNYDDKLDRNKDFIISPVSFESKYVNFNYDDNNTDFNRKYLKAYETNFGGLKIKTLYEFNDESIDLFKGLKTSMVNTGTFLSWNNIMANKIIFYQTSETMPYFEDNKEKTDSFGCFYFYKGLETFDAELGPVKITDDSQHQILSQTYCYDLTSGISVKTYPYLDIHKDNNLCLFNNPSETYDIDQGYREMNSIYTNFWKRWIDEQYNIQNKRISCYLDIKPIDYLKFEFKKFLIIHNQLYLLNSIKDYDLTDPDTTKVELIGIQDPEAYTTINYGELDYLIPESFEINLTTETRYELPFEANFDISVLEITDDNWNATISNNMLILTRGAAIPIENQQFIIKIGNTDHNLDITVNININ